MSIAQPLPLLSQVHEIDQQRIKNQAAPLITCVIPVYNEEKNLPELVPQLCRQLATLSPRYEILIVDDGSQDHSADVAIELADRYPVNVIKFSRNFGKENAITAGLENCRGDLIVLMDADFQHPLGTIAEFFDYWRQGYDMVYGVRNGRENESAAKKFFTRCFYRVLQLGADVPIEADAGDFRLLDRRVVDALKNLPERNRFMKGLYGWVGFKSLGIPFNVDERQQGKTSFTPLKLIKLAITGLTAFTTFPLHVWSIVGILISLLSMIYGIFITVKTLVFGVDLPGWATLAAGVTFLGGVQLLSIGVLGEYVAKIFAEVKARPTYIVSEMHEHSEDENLK